MFSHLQYKDYYCVTAKQCTEDFKGHLLKLPSSKDLCVTKCPEGYRVTPDDICVTCRDCDVTVCPGEDVQSYEQLVKLQGCTHITGSLTLK